MGFPREDGWKLAGLNCYFIFAHGSQLPWAIADGLLGEALSGCCRCFLASEVWHRGTQWCGVMLPCEGLGVQFIWSWWGARLAVTTLGQSIRVLGSAAGLYFVPWSCLLSSSYEAEWRPQGFVVWHPCGSQPFLTPAPLKTLILASVLNVGPRRNECFFRGNEKKMYFYSFFQGKSKEAEIKRINKELANIRSKFKGKCYPFLNVVRALWWLLMSFVNLMIRDPSGHAREGYLG